MIEFITPAHYVKPIEFKITLAPGVVTCEGRKLTNKHQALMSDSPINQPATLVHLPRVLTD